MKLAWLCALALTIVQSAAASPASEGMRIVHVGSQPANTGAAANFSGLAHVQPVLNPEGTSRLSAGYVTFAPGARSAWHTHPAGQLLIIIAGTGWVQEAGKPRQTVRAGDVIWTPPGVKHWHGATATTSMTQLATQETVDGANVSWMEKVSDAQFGATR